MTESSKNKFFGKKLLLVGFSTRHLAESAMESGYDFITLDYFGDLDQKKICGNHSLKRDFHLEIFDPKDLFLASQDLDFDAIVYSSPFENYPQTIKEFERRCMVIGNSSKNSLHLITSDMRLRKIIN